jgi:RNA polymerase sigma factor (sigma-70 family)
VNEEGDDDPPLLPWRLRSPDEQVEDMGRVFGILRGYFDSRLRDSHLSEDLAQEVCVRIYRKRDEIDQLMRYAFTSARNILTDHWRRTDRNRELPAGAVPDDLGEWSERHHDIDQVEAVAHRQELLDFCEKHLTRRQREIFELIHLEELTNAEAAEVLGITEGTVRSQLSLAGRRLAEHFDEADSELKSGR